MMSSSSSESDFIEGAVSEVDTDSDDLELFVGTRLHPRNSNFVDGVVPQFNDNEFFNHFRVSRDIVEMLAQRYKSSTVYHFQFGPYGKIEAREQILIFLWFSGHQTSSFSDVADRFDISKSTLFKILNILIRFVSGLAPEIIKWPTADEMRISEQAFRRKGFPGAIGAIDGSHIKIDKPSSDPESYFNRKQYYSIQLQVVCDNRKKIIDIFVGYPGSVHDARVFRVSPLADTLPEKCGELVILADSAYPCLPNLITPYKDRGNLTMSQRNFNKIHSANRIAVEHCFGLLKQKFRQLYHIKLRKIDNIVHFIRACCVLHNLALDNSFPEDLQQPLEDPSHLSAPDDGADDEPQDHGDGQAVRDRIRLSIAAH